MRLFIFELKQMGIGLTFLNPQTAGVPYTEQNHLHGKRREFNMQNNAQKTKENDIKTILFSLAYLRPIKHPFISSTGIGLPSGQCYKQYIISFLFVSWLDMIRFSSFIVVLS